MLILLIGPAFLAGYLLAHFLHQRTLTRGLAESRASAADALRAAAASLTNIDSREQLARELAREAMATCPKYAVGQVDNEATVRWMQEQLINTGRQSFLRVCTSLEGLRELATSTPRHGGDAIVFPVFLAREILGLPPFDGTETPAVEPVNQFMTAVPPTESVDPVPFPKPQVRNDF